MRPSIVFEKNRRTIRKIVESGEFDLTNPRVFGSVLHGTDRENSDLDLLVDASPETTFFDLYGLEAKLEALLGIPVQVLASDGLPAKFKEAVLAEACPI